MDKRRMENVSFLPFPLSSPSSHRNSVPNDLKVKNHIDKSPPPSCSAACVRGFSKDRRVG